MQTIINGVLTNYEIINPKAKKDLLVLHGWGQKTSDWLPLTKLLKNNYRYYLLDLPGFGGTKNLNENSNIPEYTLFVKNFVDKLKLKDFILLGHSFGGQIAGDYAIKFPEDLEKIILISPATIRIRGLKTKIKIIFTKIIKPLLSFLPTSTKNIILSLYAPPEYFRANKYLRTVLRKILKYDLSSKLHLIKVPADIVWGSEDKVIPYMGKYLVENIPDSKLHIIYGSGHHPHLTHTTKLANELNKILSKNESA